MIRDFIYVDADRLYSVYSQVFEGVAEKIVQSYVNELTSSNQNTSALRGASAETQVAEVSRRTENKLLYDHMYNQLEAKISQDLVDPASMSEEDLLSSMTPASLVKLTGFAEIEDFSRLKVLLDRFNELGLAIAQAQLKTSSEVGEAEAQVAQIKDRNERSRAKQELKRQTNPTVLAKAMNLHQDENLLKALRLFTEMFNPEGLDVLVTLPDREEIAFKAILDRKWLRVSSSLLRPMHAGRAAPNWTVVGHVTFVPGRDVEIADPASEETTMRDSFRGMFRAAREFERLFFEGKGRPEIIVVPIAIYTEASLPTVGAST